MLDALAMSTGIVALAEVGDKTQLLSFFLAARYRRAWPIVWGILIATLLNHGLAGAMGVLARDWLEGDSLQWALGLGFVAMAVWLLIPDRLDNEPKPINSSNLFLITLVAFFIAEMGDKTQVATVGLAAHYNDYFMVVIGTTLGMMIANVPAVLIGERLAERLPKRMIQSVAAALMAALGVVILVF